MEKYTSQQQYRTIPRRGTQFVFNIGDVATFRQDLDRVEEQSGQSVLLTYETNGHLDGRAQFPAFILLMISFIVMMRNASKGGAGGQGGVFNVGKARRRCSIRITRTRSPSRMWPGLEEAKVEVMEIVDFLRNRRNTVNWAARSQRRPVGGSSRNGQDPAGEGGGR